jgi:hypothetical protein
MNQTMVIRGGSLLSLSRRYWCAGYIHPREPSRQLWRRHLKGRSISGSGNIILHVALPARTSNATPSRQGCTAHPSICITKCVQLTTRLVAGASRGPSPSCCDMVFCQIYPAPGFSKYTSFPCGETGQDSPLWRTSQAAPKAKGRTHGQIG